MKHRDDAAMIFNRGASLARAAFFCLGCLMVILGIVGAFLPLMPTTIFLILAAWCFGKSSPRLEAWLLDHPRFGNELRSWRSHGAIPRRAKLMACAGMTFGFVMFWLSVHPSWLVAAGIAALLLGSAVYVASRPRLTAEQ